MHRTLVIIDNNMNFDQKDLADAYSFDKRLFDTLIDKGIDPNRITTASVSFFKNKDTRSIAVYYNDDTLPLDGEAPIDFEGVPPMPFEIYGKVNDTGLAESLSNARYDPDFFMSED